MSGRIVAGWPAPPGVVAFTTCRDAPGASLPPFDICNLGNTAAGGDDPDAVARNRAGLIDAFGLPSPPRWLRQVHGTAVVRIDASGAVPGDDSGDDGDDGASPSLPGLRTGSGQDGESHGNATWPADAEPPEADASVTALPGVVLAVLHADCLPVVLAARDGSEVAVAHAGWRGLAAGVLEATVAAMAAPGPALLAWLGPAAGPDRYEVGDEVREAFMARDAGAASAFVATRPGHWRVHLYALARQRLAAAGVADVHGGDLCTLSDRQRFYSHRRDARTGRMATLVWRTVSDD